LATVIATFLYRVFQEESAILLENVSTKILIYEIEGCGVDER
jgi:hypothetical protein